MILLACLLEVYKYSSFQTRDTKIQMFRIVGKRQEMESAGRSRGNKDLVIVHGNGLSSLRMAAS